MKIIIKSAGGSLTYHCETHTDSTLAPYNVAHSHAVQSAILRDFYQKQDINFGTKGTHLTQEEEGEGEW